MYTCRACREEAEQLQAIDPLIKSYFQHQLRIARSPRAVHKARVFGLAGTVAALAVAVLLLVGKTPQTVPVAVPPVPAVSNTSVSDLPATAPPPKADDTAVPARAKPEEVESSPADRVPAAAPAALAADAPEFLVTDPAGYSHKLEEFRGRVLLIGVWKAGQTDSIANLERIYKANSSNPKFRLVSVSTAHDAKPANTTFPLFYNQGSKLLGAEAGEFVLLNESGAAELRGSLVKDFEELAKALRTK